LPLARFLGRQRQVDEALRLCEDAWRAGPAEAVAEAAVAVVRGGGTTDEQLQAVERRVVAAIEQQPDSARLGPAPAELPDTQGKYTEAITQYRQVLQRDPQHVGALNNLAWLLTLKEGQGEEALALIQRAIDRTGPRADVLDTRAVAFLTTGQSKPALDDLQE